MIALFNQIQSNKNLQPSAFSITKKKGDNHLFFNDLNPIS